MEWSFDSKSVTEAQRTRAQFMDVLHAFATAESDFAAAELIFGELLGNVVRHAPGPVQIRLQWSLGNPTLIVHDEHEAFSPSFTLPDDPFQESGRGLFIVHALAKSVSVYDIEGDGTKVSAVLPVWRAA